MGIKEKDFNVFKGEVKRSFGGLYNEIKKYKLLVAAYKNVAEQTGTDISTNLSELEAKVGELEETTSSVYKLLSEDICPTINDTDESVAVLGEMKAGIEELKPILDTLCTKEDATGLNQLVQKGFGDIKTNYSALEDTYKGLVDAMSAGFDGTNAKIDGLSVDITDMRDYMRAVHGKENVALALQAEQMRMSIELANAKRNGGVPQTLPGTDATMAAMRYFFRFGGKRYMDDHNSHTLNGNEQGKPDSRYLEADKAQQILEGLNESVEKERISKEEKAIVVAILTGSSGVGKGEETSETE